MKGGNLRLRANVPLTLLAELSEPEVRRAVDGLSAATVGEALAIRADELDLDSRAALYTVLLPWWDEAEILPPGDPLIREDYPAWFDALPLGLVDLPPLIKAALAPCRTIGELRMHPTSTLTSRNRISDGMLGKLRVKVGELYAAVSEARNIETDRPMGISAGMDAPSGKSLLGMTLRLPGDTPLALFRATNGAEGVPSYERLRVRTTGELQGLPAGVVDYRELEALQRVFEPWAIRPGDGNLEPLVQADLPEWFAEEDLSVLDLPARLNDILAPCITVGALRDHPVRTLLAYKSMGDKAVERLRVRVAETLGKMTMRFGRENGAGKEALPTYDASEPLLAHLGRHMHLPKERHAQIAGTFIGLHGPRMNNTEQAKGLGVTSERVRQIVETGLSRIDAVTRWRSVLAKELSRHVGRVVPIRDLVSASWASGMCDELVRFFVHDLIGSHVIDLSPGPLVACPVRPKVWDVHGKILRGMLHDSRACETHENVLARFSNGLEHGGEREALMAMARLYLGQGSVVLLNLRHKRKKDAVRSVLIEAGGPLHEDEILARLRAHGATGADMQGGYDAFLNSFLIHAGGRVFMLPAAGHVPEWIGRTCETIMAGAPPERRWTTEEILARVKADQGQDAGVWDAARLEASLLRIDKVQRVRAGLWRLRGATEAPSSPLELAVRILEEAGKPMPTRELMSRLKREWGGVKSITLNQTRQLVILKRGLWGLADRDIRIDHSMRCSLVSDALALIEGGNYTLDRLFEALGEACARAGIGNADLLGSILRLDAGVHYAFRTDVVRLASTMPPHREGSIRQAIRDVLRLAEAPMTSREIKIEVLRRTGISPSRGSISHGLGLYGSKLGSYKDARWVFDPRNPDAPA